MSRESALRALRHMRQRDQGHITQIGSALSYRAIPLQSACAAFTDSLRAELIQRLSMGARLTPPLRRRLRRSPS